MTKWGIQYTGTPIHLTYDGQIIHWAHIPRLVASKGKDLSIDGWRFHSYYGRIYLHENKSDWVCYLPDGPLGVVVDVGAGCGESAKFFLGHGASKVISIENNPSCIPYLEENARRFGFTYRFEDFDPEFLFTLKFDTLKLDIEGWEMLLLPYLDRLMDVNIVLESHCDYITQRFLGKGFTHRKLYGWGNGYLWRPRRTTS